MTVGNTFFFHQGHLEEVRPCLSKYWQKIIYPSCQISLVSFCCSCILKLVRSSSRILFVFYFLTLVLASKARLTAFGSIFCVYYTGSVEKTLVFDIAGGINEDLATNNVEKIQENAMGRSRVFTVSVGKKHDYSDQFRLNEIRLLR